MLPNKPGTQSTFIPILGTAKLCNTSLLKNKKLFPPTETGKGKDGSKLYQISLQEEHKLDIKLGTKLDLYSQNHWDASTCTSFEHSYFIFLEFNNIIEGILMINKKTKGKSINLTSKEFFETIDTELDTLKKKNRKTKIKIAVNPINTKSWKKTVNKYFSLLGKCNFQLNISPTQNK